MNNILGNAIKTGMNPNVESRAKINAKIVLLPKNINIFLEKPFKASL